MADSWIQMQKYISGWDTLNYFYHVQCKPAIWNVTKKIFSQDAFLYAKIQLTLDSFLEK